MAQIAKQAELKQRHENKSQQQSYMQTKYRSNHKFQAIKEAVESESISIQEANEMIMKQKKQTNSQLLVNLRNSAEDFKLLCKQAKSKISNMSIQKNMENNETIH